MGQKFFYIWFLLIGPGFISAQNPVPSPAVQVAADTLQIRIGEPITLTLSARKDSSVRFPSARDSIGKVQVIDFTPVDTLPARYRQKWVVTAYDSGKYKIDPLPFVVGGDTVYTQPIGFEVYGVAVDTTVQQMYDVKPIYRAPYTFREFSPWLVGGIVLLLAVVGLVLFIRNRKRKDGGQTPATVWPPHIEALNRLKALDDKPYLKQGKYKAYYSELTEVLRRYFERRYGFSALESTSDEILAQLKTNGDFSKDLYRSLARFLKESDLVKFAKLVPQQANGAQYRKEVERMVNETTRVEREADGEGTGV